MIAIQIGYHGSRANIFIYRRKFGYDTASTNMTGISTLLKSHVYSLSSKLVK